MDAEPPKLAVPPRLAIVAKAEPARRVVRESAPGWHVHRCPNGHEWSHPDTAFNREDEHTCPVCRVVLPRPWLPTERNVRLTTVSPPPVLIPVVPVPSRDRFVVLSASWCVPCLKWKAEEYAKLAKVMPVVYGDAVQLGVTAYPTFIYERDGKEVWRVTGYTTADTLVSLARGKP